MLNRWKRAVSGVACAALVAGLVPAAAWAVPGQLQAASAAFALRAQEIDADAGSYAPGQVIVVYEDAADASMSAQALADGEGADGGVEVLAEDVDGQGATAVLVDVPEGTTVGQAVAAAEAQPGVAYAQPNYRYFPIQDMPGEGDEGADGPDGAQGIVARAALAAQSALSPLAAVDDPYANVSASSATTPNQWWLYAVDAFEAWDLAQVEGTVTVAVLDTGINFEHEDLAGIVDKRRAYDAYRDRPLTKSPTDSELSHGSHVAGIVAGEAGNGVGIAGVSHNARVLPINVFHIEYFPEYFADMATCSDDDLIRAYEYLMSDPDGDGSTIAQDANVRVVNMSLGGYDDDIDVVFQDILLKAEDQGILTVAAAGNGINGVAQTDNSWPSDYENVVSVVALNNKDTRPTWCDHNDRKNISAPGVDIWSTWYTGNEYHCSSGTSMASPLVAGVAALLFAYNPGLTPAQVRDALYTTADSVGGYTGYSEYYGWGKVNPVAALRAVDAVSVQVAETSLVRTQAVQAQVVASAAHAARTWEWSSSDESVATVDAQGLICAVGAGQAEISVADASDAQVGGSVAVTVADLEIPGAIAAVGRPSTVSVQVTWPAAPQATGYDVYRSASEDGAYAPVGSVDAGDGAADVTFDDATVEEGVEYWYKAVPVGAMPDGAQVQGIWTGAASAHVTGKGALGSLMNRARADRSQTTVAESGADVPEGEWWTTAAESDALDTALLAASGAYYDSQVPQEALDGALALLADAVDEFEAARQPGLKHVETPPVDDQGGGSDSGSGSGGGSGSGNGSDSGSDSGGDGSGGSQNPDALPAAGTFTRLSGNTALDTMQAIVECPAGFSEKGGTVIVATLGGYWDALTASGLAGVHGAPVLMTDGGSLSPQTRAELVRLAPARVIVCGGEAAVSAGVAAQVQSVTGVAPERLAGADAPSTALAVYRSSRSWGDACVIATASSFQDALSIAPYAYRFHCPVFLTDGEGGLSSDVLAEVRAGFSTAIIVGGTAAVAGSVDSRLADAGLQVVRLAGADALGTSREIALWELGHGMSAACMGVATVDSYYDALCGAALCGKSGSVLVLVGDGDSGTSAASTAIVAAKRSGDAAGYVFGGTSAIPHLTFAVLANHARQ